MRQQTLDPTRPPATGQPTLTDLPTGQPNHPDPDLLGHLSAAERELFHAYGWGPSAVVPHTHIHHAFERWAATTPDAPAAEHLGRRITYGQLDRQADRLARRLVAEGVRPGDRVALFVRRSIPMLVGMLATLKAGAAYVPQQVGVAPPEQLRYVAETAATTVILTQTEYADLVPVPDGTVLIAVDQVMAGPDDGDDAAPVTVGSVSADDGCYVLFTSGTTGRPNGVTVTHRNVCNLLLTSPGDLGIRPGWRVGQILNIAFDMAAWEILGALSHGATLVIRGDSIAETVGQVDVVIATPTVLGGLDPTRCERVKVVAVAGEPCPVSLATRWATPGRVFWNSCGPTETTIVNTMHRYEPGRPPTIGRPTPNNTVYVLDDDLRPLPVGAVGEMWAGGDCVSAGYLGNPELDAERYRPDPFLGGGRRMFRTRDLGRWTADGELEHLGRTDDQVKVRGFRVELDSVSAVLESVPGCRRAVTLKVDDRTLVSFVTPADVPADEARQAVARTLPYYCVPEAVHPLPELPVTSRGKIDKAALLALATAPAPTNATAEATGTAANAPTSAPAVDPDRRPPLTPLPRRLFKHKLLMHYNRLIAAVLAVNLVVGWYGLARGWFTTDPADLTNLSRAALANVALAVVVRQQYVINLFFRVATSIPTSWPLRLRWTAGKVYHFGGLHVGGTVAGTLWFGAFVAASTWRAATAGDVPVPPLVVAYLLVALLLGLVATALPPFRGRFHDAFERIHRFGGWSALALLWTHTVLSVPTGLLSTVEFWALVGITVSVALPWLRLRRVPVVIDRPSSHVALVRFNHGETPFAGSSTAVSRRPLMEWHSFANVPTPGEPGFRLTISRAGDWTGSFIDDAPSHVWVKGITTAGVANIEVLFTKVVYVATGSGIGPVLPHLLARKVPAHLVWATRNPRKTYGDALVDEILAVQPDAEIWDTGERGKPDMVALACRAYAATGAEAVICISNKKLTWQVVQGLEQRGIPAFGAIWDS